MPSPLNRLIQRFRPKQYARRPPLLLINGLAEQAESWYRNRRFWSRYYDVFAPNVMVFEGKALHERVDRGETISVDYLVDQYKAFLDQFVQTPPYHIVASSLGGKVAIELAVRHPDLVSKLVLICPSGMGDKEQLPIMEGVKAKDMYALVRSVFYRTRYVDRDLVKYYKARLESRRWKKGMLRSVKGTLDHTVREKMHLVRCPTLLITGAEDKICDPRTAEEAARELPSGEFLAIPKCGHAPQIEKHWLINRLVVRFLSASGLPAHAS